MSTEMAPTDPMAREQWLSDNLTEAEAAKFLGIRKGWLANARGTPGKGPPYKRYSLTLIRYLRRDLIAWSEAKTCHSTLDYRRPPEGQDSGTGGDA